METNYDSDYQVRLATLEALGGDVTLVYDSVYEIDLEILRLTEHGIGTTYTAGQNIYIDASNAISAEGYNYNVSNGAFGQYNVAHDSDPTTIGDNKALGQNSVVFGQDNTVLSTGETSGIIAGQANRVGGAASVALGGWSNTVNGNYAVCAGGEQNIVSGEHAFATGFNCTASNNNSFAEGYKNVASGIASHAEGWGTNSATGGGSHAEGVRTQATGEGAHAEGLAGSSEFNVASGDGAHAEGSRTQASGNAAHSEGLGSSNKFNIASGNGSHTEGCSTTAQNLGEHAQGNLNVSHKASNNNGDAGNTTHSIGIGLSVGSEKNAEEIMQNGDCYLYGVGGYQGTDTKIQNASILTLQDVINSKADVYEVATIAEIEALFATPEPEPTYPPLNQIWYTTLNGESYNFEEYTSIWDVRTWDSIMATSNVYSNGKGVITYPQDLVDMSNFGNIAEWDAENATATVVWLPYLTKTTVINGDGESQVIYPFDNILNNVDTLTDVYYPGTVAELTEAMYNVENSGWVTCLYSDTKGDSIVNAIHCSDGDFDWDEPV